MENVNALQGKLKAQSGFSLLELLLVVGVGALLLLAGIATYRLVTQGNNVNDAIRVLATIKSQTQRAFQGQRSYGAVGTDLIPTLVTMNAFPAGTVGDDDLPRHPWGGDITVAGNDQEFIVSFVDVPPDGCVQVGTTFDVDDTDFVSLNVGGEDFVPGGDPITAPAMADACGDAPVTMTWTFY